MEISKKFHQNYRVKISYSETRIEQINIRPLLKESIFSKEYCIQMLLKIFSFILKFELIYLKDCENKSYNNVTYYYYCKDYTLFDQNIHNQYYAQQYLSYPDLSFFWISVFPNYPDFGKHQCICNIH